MTTTIKSIEEQVEDWCKKQFEGQKYFTKTETINPEIDDALSKAPSKKGGTGKNFPDIKFFIETSSMRRLPVMIEVKGKKGDFEKLTENGNVDNKKKDGEPNFSNIARYAVNGAVHYADAILHYTHTYKEVIAIGVNGYMVNDQLKVEIGVYYVSMANLYIPKRVPINYSDLSFLLAENVNAFVKQIDGIDLTEEEIEKQRLELEDDIERKLKDINQMMHDEQGIAVGDRVQLIAGLIMAGLGVPEKVSPLAIEDLRGERDEESNDGAIIMRKISAYLKEKHLPQEKISMIKDILNKVFLHSRLEVPVNGESKLKTIYREVKTNIMPFVTGELHSIDFTGRLFNVLNEWVDVPDGDKNDVVLTPRYVTELMAKLCRVGMDSYVWDFAAGSAGFLISSMHQMISDANSKISSFAELNRKIQKIKMEQILGIEKLPDIYMLAVLNMILMKDGSANIIHGNSFEFKGMYEQGAHKGEIFPANVFLLNPPYSASGKGFSFVEHALSMMKHGGRAAILIQENAGSGFGLPYTKNILQHNTLVASIKMSDIFCGKASVQTAIYVFDINIPHNQQSIVKFIDFSEDGYSRQNRKKSSQSVNLQNTDHANERYEEIVNLVLYGSKHLNYYKNHYVEDTISLDGNDWTYGQHRNVESEPTSADFYNVIKDYLAWRASEAIKNESIVKDDEINSLQICKGGYSNFRLGDLFDIHPTKAYAAKNAELFTREGNNYVISNSSTSNGISGTSSLDTTEKGNMITFSDTTTSDAIFYQPFDFIGYPHVQGLYPKKYKNKWSEESLLYVVSLFKKQAKGRFDYATKFTRTIAADMMLPFPVKDISSKEIDFDYMEEYVKTLKKLTIEHLKKELDNM